MSRSFVFVMLLVLGVAAQAEAQVRLEGRVRAVDGSPVPGAVIRLRGLDIPPASVTADVTGRYVFPDLKGTWVVLVAWADGRPIAEAAGLITRANEVIDLVAQPTLVLAMNAYDLDPLEGPAGVLSGTVRSATGAAVPGARVTIRGTGVSAATDTFGRYDLGRIRAGLQLTLDASAAGFGSAEIAVQVRADERTATDFTLPSAAPGSSRVELAPVNVPAGSATVSFPAATVTGLAASRIGDVGRALELLPAVRGSLEEPTGFNIRGGSADQTALTYEGMTIYPFSGLRGMFGGFDPAAVAGVDLSEDALGAPSAGLPGAVHFRSLPGVYPTRPTGYFDASAFGVGGRVLVPVADRAALVVSGRGNPPASLYENVLKEYSVGQGLFVPGRVPAYTGGALAASPTVGFRDLNATLEVRPTVRDRLSVSYYDATDAANLSRNIDIPGSNGLNQPDPDRLPDQAVTEVSEVYDWSGTGASATWRRDWAYGITSLLSFGQTEFRKTDARAFLLRSANTGEDFSYFGGRTGSDALINENRLEHTSVRFEVGKEFGFGHGLTIGGEVAEIDASYAGLVELPVSVGLLPSALVASGNQASSGQLVRLHARDQWRPTSKLLLSLGARMVRFSLESGVHVEPLVSATYMWKPDVQVVGSWSVSRQPAVRVTREDRLRGDTEFWALANGTTIRMPRVEHGSLGARFERPGLVLDASMYYKRLSDLTMLGPVHVPIWDTPRPEPIFHTGTGRAAGVNLLLQSQIEANDLWISYTGGRAVQSFPTLEAGTFVAPFDRTHEFKIADTWRVKGPLSLGLTWVTASALPTTSATRKRVWVDGTDQVYRTEFGAKNGVRMTAYQRLDVTGELTFRLSASTVTLGATVFNAYDHANARRRTYEVIGSSIDLDGVTFIGRTVNAFLRVGF